MGKSLKGAELGRGIGQRADGRYHGRALINGIKVEVYNKNLAQLRKEFELAKSAALQENIMPKEEGDVSFQEYFDSWFNTNKRFRLKSITSQNAYYRRVKNTYCEVLKDAMLRDLTQEKIQLATNELSEKYTPRTIREALSAVRECLDVAAVNNRIQRNPVIHINIKNDRDVMKERKVLTEYEQKVFLDAIKGDFYEEFYKIMIATGMRIGEASALCWEDVDYERKVIRINKSMETGYVNGKKILHPHSTKTTSSVREIPFLDGVEDLFKSWEKKQKKYKEELGDRWRMDKSLGNLCFCTTRGSALTRYNIVHNIAKHEKNIRLNEEYMATKEGRKPYDFPHIHPHMFRHMCATRLLERSVDLMAVKDMLGHTSIEMTAVYAHMLDDKKKAELAKAGNLFD